MERYYGLGMDALATVCSRNTNVSIVWAWMPERSRTAPCCPATKHCEYGHKMASGSLASARNPTPVSKVELLQPPQNRAVTPGWREEPVRLRFGIPSALAGKLKVAHDRRVWGLRIQGILQGPKQIPISFRGPFEVPHTKTI